MSYSFGNKLKILRKKYNITQQDLANELNTTKATICRWENGSREPNIDLIKKIASVLNTSIDDLLDYNAYDYEFEYQHNNTKLIHKEKK